MMHLTVLTETFPEPPFCEAEILRYAGCRNTGADGVTELLQSCLQTVRGKLTYRVCWCELPVSVADGICDFGVFSMRSGHLATNLKECKTVILFAATVGVTIDRLITRYSRLSPSQALMLQAIGAERIEALCDCFCTKIATERGVGTRPRFSPGYGDLPLDAQREIFSLLDCPKRIGLSLNDSLLMSPSKSVTAFLGLTATPAESSVPACESCEKRDCIFRNEIRK